MRIKRIVMYQDSTGRWRWRVLAANNKVIAASEQGHRSYYFALAKAKLAGGINLPVIRKSGSDGANES